MSRHLRILMLSDRFPPEARASGHLFHELATGLAERGHEVAVITRMPGDYVPATAGAAPRMVPARERLDGVDVLRVRGLSALSALAPLRALDQVAVGMTFALKARRWPGADVVLIYSPPLPLAVAGTLYQRWFGAPYVLNLHDLYPRTAVELGLLRNRLAIRGAEALERFAYRRAARIVVTAPRSREYLMTRHSVPADRIAFVPNWVDLDAELPGPRDNAFRQAHGLSGSFVVSYAGVMGFAQDLAPLIGAARKLRDRKDIVFLLVGDGVHLTRWQGMAEGLENVRFLPMLSKGEYFELLRAADLCVVPLSRTLESPAIPGKIQSIMAVARPVLALVSPFSDAADLVVKSHCGLIVPPENVDEIAQRIGQLRDDPELGDTLGANGRAYAEQNFSRRQAVTAYQHVLVAVAATRAPARASR